MNIQVNSLLEIIHQVIAKLVCMFDLKNDYLDEDDPWLSILSATYFISHSMYHKILQARVNITVHNHMVSVPTVRYQYLLPDFLHTSNNNLIILT